MRVTPVDVDDRAEVRHLAEAIQDVTGQSVTLAYVDQAYTGAAAAEAARIQGIQLELLNLPGGGVSFAAFLRRIACGDGSLGRPT